MLNRLQSSPALSAHRLMPLAVLAAFLGAAAAGGVVVASGNLVLTGLAIGAIMGVLLLNAPGVAVWVVLIGTLAVTGPVVMHFPQLGRIAWLFSILGFFLLGASILYEGTNRDPHRPRMPVFMVLALAFMVYSIGMLALGEGSMDQGTAALKRYFQYWGVAFVLATATFAPAQVRRWLVFLLLLSLIQLPFAIYQRLVLMPQRLNMPNQVVPVDIVAGTFEGSLFGGANNNVMVYLLIGAICGLLAMHREGMLRRWGLALMLLVVATPLVLGETKMVLVMMPLALWAVYADLVRRRPFAFAAGALAVGTLMAGLFYVYVQFQATEGRAPMTFQQRLEENFEYNFGERGYFGGASLNRASVVPFWWREHGANDPVGTLFGHGIGASYGQRGVEETGHVDRRYPGYSIGLTTIATLLWDVGVFGVFLYCAMLVGAFRAAKSLAARASPGLDRATCRTLQAMVAMIPPTLIALDAHIIAPSLQVLTMTTLGLIAWRWRQERRA
ncbi:MAG TPA: hypothetical protein VEA81_10705 [Burkholderiaceae bacterium]|nr:hypothetical protein [Burkholderiaceae bacterium]